MASPSAGAKPYVIFIVEDNPMGLKPVRVTLEKAGYIVREARDGRALLAMMAERPDLIIQDLMLPDIDGFELVRKIRDLPGGADVPIIAYSGLMTRLEEARSIEVGFTDYLFKPIAPERLLETVEAYLPQRDGRKKVGHGKRVLVVDDDPTHLKLAKARLERAGFTVTTAEGATGALMLARRSPPDLILSDVLMPESDGFHFCLAVRQDAELARIPVLLFTAAYDEEADRKLARDAGANGLVLKSPGFEAVVDAVASALAAPAPQAQPAVRALGEDYTRRLARVLDRQMILTASVRQRLMRREAELAILSSFFDSLKRGSGDEILEEMLHRVVHAAGMSRGLIYIAGQNGTLVPRAKLGYPRSVDPQLGDFFGHAHWLHSAMEERAPKVAPALGMPREILSGGEPAEQSALITPLLQGNECLGVLVLTSGKRTLTEEMLPFAGAVGSQIGQALGLIRTLVQPRENGKRFRGTLDRIAAGGGRASPAGGKPLPVIIIDDQAARADLVIHELFHGGFAPDWQRAATESEYLARLTPAVDLIVARDTLPHFDARRGLELLHAQHLDIPFIVVSPAVGAEAAAALVKLGAADYVLDDRLGRLPQAVERALEHRHLFAEKEQAVTRLRGSEERYRSLFDGVPVGLYRASLDGLILDVNPAFVQMLSYPDRETLLAVDAAELYLDPGVRADWTALLKRDGIVTGFESQLRRFDGSTIWVRANARIVRDPFGEAEFLEGAIFDISKRKRAEEAIHRRAAHLEALNAVIASAASASDLSELLAMALERTRDALGCEIGASWTGDVQVVRGISAEARPWLGQAQAAGLEFLGPQTVPDWQAVGDVPDGVAALMAKLGIRASITFPIQTRAQTTGGILVASPNPHPWLPEEVLLAETIGRQIGDAVERLRLSQAIKRRTTELEAFYDLSRRLRAASSVDEMYPIVVEQAMDILGCQHGYLELLTPERDTFIRAFLIGASAGEAGSTFPVAGSRSGEVVQTGVTFVTADFSSAPSPVWKDASQHDLGPLAIVPVRSEQEMIGALGLGRGKTGESRPFTDAEVRLLEGIAEIAGTAIRRARLHQNLQQAYVQMVLMLAQALESRDSYTSGHSERMVRLAEKIARELACAEEEVQNIRWGARLHDVGKIGIPDGILNKPGGFSEAEWKMMRQHPIFGEEILKSVERMRPVAKLVRHHQERWDGTGYPDRLQGEAIPLGSRILAVVDAYGAITEARPYKPSRTHAEAVEEIRRSAGTQFDPRAVEVFVQVVELAASTSPGPNLGANEDAS